MKKTLGARVKEALHRYSFFGKIEEVADKRRHLFHKRLPAARDRVEAAERRAKAAPKGQRQEDEAQILALAEEHLKRTLRKREFWRDRYAWAHQRHQHWGTVLRHRRDRVRRWIKQHEGFRPYMANGKPWEALTPEAKHGIYLDFREGLYVTSTYEGYPGDGVHSDTSFHYLQNQPDGKARCWDAGAGTRGPMAKAQERQARTLGSFLTEMFGPINELAYKNGIRETLPEGSSLEEMHDNHVHTDIRDGAPR